MQLLAIAYNGAGSFTFVSAKEFEEKIEQYSAEEWDLSIDAFECDGVLALDPYYMGPSKLPNLFEAAEYIEEHDIPKEVVSRVCDFCCDIDELLPKLESIIYYPEDEYIEYWQALNVGDAPGQVPEAWAMYMDYDLLYQDDEFSDTIDVCGKFFIANPDCL